MNMKIGDIFSVNIADNLKRYFQYITNDLTQLNSDVIRAFKKVYPLEEDPNPLEVINDEIDFYAHCIIKLGIKMGLWKKESNIHSVGKIDHILFRSTSDYGIKIGEEPIQISNKWYVWNIGDKDFTKIGKLESIYENAFIGLVINPYGIVELLKGNKYPINYPR